MFKERNFVLIEYVIIHCDRIIENTKGITRKEFDENQNLKDIICFNVLQIGELIKKMPIEFLNNHPYPYWKDIKGMRDRIAHGYGSIDWDEVWTVASINIVPLKDRCEQILKEEKNN